jgi:hypothetical protein
VVVKPIKINFLNRFYFIFKSKRYIKSANKIIEANNKTINEYLTFTDMEEIAANRKYYDNAVAWIKEALERKARWEALLADLRANNVMSIDS